MMLTRGRIFPSGAGLDRLALGHRAALAGEFRPKPVHRAIGALPLVFVDRARQEAQQVGAFGRDATADHLGDGSGDDNGGQIRIERRVRALHRTFGAFAPQLLLGQACDDDGQLVRRQRVGVVQHRRHRKILATDGTVDHDLQSLHRSEDVDGAPVATRSIVIEDQHLSSLRGK